MSKRAVIGRMPDRGKKSVMNRCRKRSAFKFNFLDPKMISRLLA